VPADPASSPHPARDTARPMTMTSVSLLMVL
jgi:hypothetical protein